MHKPNRLIYLSSNMYLQGKLKVECFGNESDEITYSDSKLHVLMLAKAVARKWDKAISNAVDPGWVPTKLGGKGALTIWIKAIKPRCGWQSVTMKK